ncbi:MAG: (cytosine-5)-methyltransferase 1 [Thermoleophilaceae bacterium]|nr:(cytosine-5)-methyltransferase 1 [Thermoleophilaceae bacterium]
MSSSRPHLTAVDLFCGAGGLSQGLDDAGFDIVAAADHDPDSCATHRLNFADTVMVEGDLTARENHASVIEAVGGRDLDLLAGGPPCQAFSQMRNHDRLIDDPRNRLYREFVQLLDELRPRALLLENVPGMDQLQGGAVRRRIEEDLSLGGDYTIVSGVLDAADFGVPQRRPRLVFIGAENGGEPELPGGTGVSRYLRSQPSGEPARTLFDERRYWLSVLADSKDARAVTAQQAIGDLVDPGDAYTGRAESAYQRNMRRGSRRPQDHEPSRIRADTIERLRAIPPGGNIYDLPDHLLRRYLGASKWGPAGDGERLARRHFYAYRRLHPDWVAWTVNTKADFAYHYGPARGLSVREAARIQGFSDRFHFTTAPPGTPGQLKNGARHSRYRQVGNAVPPLLAQAIGLKIAELLGVQRPVLRAVA